MEGTATKGTATGVTDEAMVTTMAPRHRYPNRCRLTRGAASYSCSTHSQGLLGT